jgi:hypothetical protein
LFASPEGDHGGGQLIGFDRQVVIVTDEIAELCERLGITG